MSIKIYRGFEKEIFFTMRDKETGDAIDLTASTDIRACIQTLELDVGGGGVVVTDATAGKFKVVISVAQSAALDIAFETITGQVEFGSTNDPREFTASVQIKDKPC
jgi:hypothetical protein